MKKFLILVVIFLLIGLIVGYFIFGKNAMGSYVDISRLFKFSGGDLGKFGRSLSGIAEIRKNILLSGGAGAVVGAVLYFTGKK